jgi:hypothetical protein
MNTFIAILLWALFAIAITSTFLLILCAAAGRREHRENRRTRGLLEAARRDENLGHLDPVYRREREAWLRATSPRPHNGFRH